MVQDPTDDGLTLAQVLALVLLSIKPFYLCHHNDLILGQNELNHWGRVTHICMGDLTIIGSDNGLTPGRRQAITWSNAVILLIGPSGTNLSEILIKIHTFQGNAYKTVVCKTAAILSQPQCVRLSSARLLPIWSSKRLVNSLAPGRPRCHFKTAIFNFILLIGIFTSSKYNALRWMPRDLTDDKSTLVQVMAWCRQATSHYLSQCWPSSMLPYGITRPQWVNPWYIPRNVHMVHVLLCYTVVRYWPILPISFRVTSLTLWHLYDCPSASGVNLKKKGLDDGSAESTESWKFKSFYWYNQTKTKHNKTM